jgi:hypothetical protein
VLLGVTEDSEEEVLEGAATLKVTALGDAIALEDGMDTTETPVTVEIPAVNKKAVSVARSRLVKGLHR